MLPCRSSEESRRKNQFTKDERLHLLNIMSQYAPLLDDKSAFGRREIWRAIERDFHQAGFTGKTSAQLKKYWQNYKYHGRRAQAGVKKYSNPATRGTTETTPHSEVPENRGNIETKEVAASPCAPPRPDASLRNVESGCRQRQIYGDNGTFFRKLSATPIRPIDSEVLEKNRSEITEISQRKRSSGKVYEDSGSSGAIDRNTEKPIGTDVIVSNTDVSNNSVTVSVICPERSPKRFSKNQLKRKREGDVSPDKSSFPTSVPAASAASPSKKRKDDDHSIFPAVAAGATKGRCFLLQPRQPDNRGEVISDRKNAVETRRKLEPAKKESTAPPSKSSALQGEISRAESTTRKGIPSSSGADGGSEENFRKQEPAAARIRDTQDSACHKERRERSKIRETAAPHNLQNDRDRAIGSDAAIPASYTPAGNAGLWDRGEAIDLVQSELRDELNYRLMLHRLETEEKRLKVKIAEMAIQEIRFRIRALNEDIRRADELHELHLALATAQADTEGLRV